MKEKTLKLIVVALCVLMCLSFVACSCSNDDASASNADEAGSTNSSTGGSQPHTHSYGEWTQTKAPTCTENGEMAQMCTCGDKQTKPVSASGHNYKSEKCFDCENVIAKSNDLEFTLNSDNESYSVSGVGSCTSKEISIPSEYEGKPVTSIADGAFENCSFTVVIIPNGVISIGNSAFKGCAELNTVTIPESVKTIGTSSFEDCIKLVTVIISEGLESIGENAFANCTALSSLFLPTSLKSIGLNAFLNCLKLVLQVVLGEVPQEWGLDGIQVSLNHTHTYGEWNITEKSTCIATGVKEQYCVCGFKNVGVVDFAPHTEEIVEGYPPTCTDTGLTDAKKCTVCGITTKEHNSIPPKHTYDKGVCSACGQEEPASEGLLFTLRYDSQSYEVSKGTCTDSEIYIPGWYNGLPVTHIADHGFFNNQNATKIVISDGIISIGETGFGTNNNLVSITLPSTLKTIGKDAFINDSKLTNIEIPAGVVSIGDQTFYGCSKITSVTIPSAVTSLGDGMFSNCTSLSKLILSDNIRYLDDIFYKCNALQYNEYENLLYLGSENNPYLILMGVSTEDITSCVVHKDTKVINGSAFSGCAQLESIELPQGLEIISPWAFSSCSKLTSIVIPNGVTTIGEGAFYDCTALESISVPDSISNIGDRAFAGCSGLAYNEFDNALYLGNSTNPYTILMMAKNKEITECNINEGTKVIYHEAFYLCKALSSIVIPNGVREIGILAFSNCNSATALVIPNTVTQICKSAFYNCNSITSIEIPDSVITIGDSAFNGCKAAQSITIGNSVTSIGVSSFANCVLPTTIVVPDSVISIGGSAFNGCTSLESLHIGTGVESIGDYVTEGSTALTGIYIKDLKKWCEIDFFDSIANPLYNGKNLYLNGELVTELVITGDIGYINHYAFNYCTSITKVIMKNGVRKIGLLAFANCPNLTSTIIPSSVEIIEALPFKDSPNVSIFCESESQPSTWNINWNKYNLPVTWNWKSTEE